MERDSMKNVKRSSNDHKKEKDRHKHTLTHTHAHIPKLAQERNKVLGFFCFSTFESNLKPCSHRDTIEKKTSQLVRCPFKLGTNLIEVMNNSLLTGN